jgi:hypothetical protein
MTIVTEIFNLQTVFTPDFCGFVACKANLLDSDLAAA